MKFKSKKKWLNMLKIYAYKKIKDWGKRNSGTIERLLKNDWFNLFHKHSKKKRLGIADYFMYKKYQDWKKRTENELTSPVINFLNGNKEEVLTEIKIANLAKISIDDDLKAINAKINMAIPYATDEEVFGKKEHWDTPNEVLANRRADCDGQAILKYFICRYFMFFKDTYLAVTKNHMFCVCNGMILDNGVISTEVRPLSELDKSIKILYKFTLKRIWK